MTNYYVKNGGNNGLDGLSYGNAWETPQHAFTTVAGGAGHIIRIDEGTYQMENATGPQSSIFINGGFWDGGWMDWDPTCGHDRPLFDHAQGMMFLNTNHSITSVEFNCVGGPAIFTNAATPYLFNHCKYNGMIYVEAASAQFVNASEDTFHHVTEGCSVTCTPPLATSEFTIELPLAFATLESKYLEIIPENSSVDVLITQWETSGDQNKSVTVNGTGPNTIGFRFGDMLPNTEYNFKVDGVKDSEATSDALGFILFPIYSGTFSEKLFETEKGGADMMATSIIIF